MESELDELNQDLEFEPTEVPDDISEEEQIEDFEDISEDEQIEDLEDIPESELVSETEDNPEEKRKAELPSVEMLEAELNKERYRSNYGQVLKSTIFYLLVVAAIAIIIAVFILPVLQISGTSMTETLDDRDIVVAISSKKYETGDVVAFYFNNNILIKRVIAKAGDWVDIDEDGNVFVNGELLDEPYVSEKAFGDCNIKLPYQVPDGKFFIMGDHRATSVDSRNSGVGCVSDEMMVGRLLIRVWPLNKIKIVK